MAKAYIYEYSGFPGDRADKYYVCKYGKGRPITYQVVPHLQRHFDKQGRANKDTLDFDRFKELRRAGHLYTGKREQKRSPLLGDVDWRSLPDSWQPLGRWLSGDVAPGDVDWQKLGRSLRRAMAEAPRIPAAIGPHLESLVPSGGPNVTEVWSRLRRAHLENAWYHHWPDGRLADLKDAPGLWDPEMLVDRLSAYETDRGLADGDGLPGASEELRLGEFPLGPLRQWTSAVALQWPEEGLRRAAGVAAELGAEAQWSEILASLPPPSGRYEAVGGTRVPADALYDVQWKMADRLQSSPWAASPWAATGRPGLVSQWHSGAASCLVITLESRVPRDGTAARLVGWLSNWSEQAREAVMDILVPEGEIAGGSPMREAVAEVAARTIDEAIAETLREATADSQTWRFCRVGRHIVLSSRQSPAAKHLMDLRRRVVRLVREQGHRISENASAAFGDRPEFIELDGHDIHLNSDGVSAKGWEAGELRRDQLAAMHEQYGDPRFAILGDPELQRGLEDLVAALTLSDFDADVLRGWYGDLIELMESP